jgi:hypothetical protein
VQPRALYYTSAVHEGVPTSGPTGAGSGAASDAQRPAARSALLDDLAARGRAELPHRLAAVLAATDDREERRVLLWSDVDGIAAALFAAGYEVVSPPTTDDGTATYTAVVVVESIEVLERLRDELPRWHRALCGGGRLVIAGLLAGDGDEPPRLPLSRDLTRQLYEAAFAVLASDRLAETGGGGAAYELHVARPDDHRVRPYREGDEGAILDLFARAFHHRRGSDHWRWEYAENPYGNLCISLAVGPDGALLAHYAGYPVRFFSDLGGAPATLPALHVGDTMTAPEARRVGRGDTNLLTRTVRHFYAVHCRGRVAFNVGANTGKIQRFSRRTAGARRLEAVPFQVRDLPGAPFAAPGSLAARLGGWRVERCARFDARFDELFHRVRGAYRLLVERDSRYLDWRYGRCPDVEYFTWTVSRRGRLAGWAVFRQEGERLVWGDALFDPAEPRAAALLLARVTAAPEHRGARRIEGWLSPRPAWWGRRVAELGFRPEPEPEDLGFVYVPFGVDPAADFAAHLYYTKGDCDLF